MALPPALPAASPLSAPPLALDACLPWLRRHVLLPEAMQSLDPAQQAEAERSNRILLASSLAQFAMAGMAGYLASLERDVVALTDSAAAVALRPALATAAESRAAIPSVAPAVPVFRRASTPSLVKLRRINVQQSESGVLQSSEARWPFPSLQAKIEGRDGTGAPCAAVNGHDVDISDVAWSKS